MQDVWTSLDGGWTWGKCVEDATFPDRRWQMTMLDNEGYFYIMGGEFGVNQTINQQRFPFNDVWRSSFSFNDPASLARLCGLPVPVCGPGLRCLPGTNTRIENGRVVCAATELCTSTRLGFRVLTSTAQWSVRHSAGLELTSAPVTIGGSNYPSGSFVLWGGVGQAYQQENVPMTDTWISSDGANWALVSATGFTGATGAAHCTDSRGRLFQVGGERDGQVISDVWMSSNQGRAWTRQTPTMAARTLPARAFADVYADSTDALYVIGGRAAGFTAAGMNDVWMSSTQGRDWVRQGAIPFANEGGRFSATLLISYSKLLRKDILTYIGGYSRVEGGGIDRYYNDVIALHRRSAALLLLCVAYACSGLFLTVSSHPWCWSLVVPGVGVVQRGPHVGAADGDGSVGRSRQLQRRGHARGPPRHRRRIQQPRDAQRRLDLGRRRIHVSAPSSPPHSLSSRPTCPHF